MRESKVEKYLVDRVEGIGGIQRKLQWGNRRNAPDRLVLFKGYVAFIELKALGKKPRIGQKREIERLQEHGARVFVIDSQQAVDQFVSIMLMDAGVLSYG
jgi:hypothetical protein